MGLTKWLDSTNHNPADLAEHVQARVIVDGRDYLDVISWQQAS